MPGFGGRLGIGVTLKLLMQVVTVHFHSVSRAAILCIPNYKHKWKLLRFGSWSLQLPSAVLLLDLLHHIVQNLVSVVRLWNLEGVQ